MSLTFISSDRLALPTALLPLAKAHMRIEFSRDDDLITFYLGAAIDYVERVTGRTLNPARYRIEAADSAAIPAGFPDRSAEKWGCGCDGVTMTGAGYPALSVSAWLIRDAIGDDVTPAYILSGGRLVRIAEVEGPVTIDVIVGPLSADDLDSGLTGLVLRYAAYLYEAREAAATGVMQTAPQWLNDLLAGHWVPRV